MLAAIYMGGCPLFPNFPGGIRMTALEAPFEAPTATLPVAEVGDFGNLTQVIGPGTGTQQSFGPSFTGANGIDDHPNAQTNANWSVTFDYTSSPIPQCGVGGQSHLVPSGGTEFKATCLL
jgi:hypothetical protein